MSTIAPPRSTTRQKVGLVLAGLFCLSQAPSVLFTTPAGEVGPPYEILLVGTVLAVVGLVATVVAWRSGHRIALRVLAASMVVIEVTALPAFFVDVPAAIKTGVAITLVWVLVSLVLVFSASAGDRAS